jgi:hypothetical protein
MRVQVCMRLTCVCVCVCVLWVLVCIIQTKKKSMTYYLC